MDETVQLRFVRRHLDSDSDVIVQILQYRTREAIVGVGCEGASPSLGYGSWSEWKDVPEGIA